MYSTSLSCSSSSTRTPYGSWPLVPGITAWDARGNTSLYGYDAMDRLKTITYNDGTPTASYTYDPTNLLTQSKNGNVTNNYTAFDGAGRVTASNVQMQGQTFTFGYQYDLSGNLTQETYPSGHVMNMTSDIVNRPQTESGVVSGTTTNYVQSAGYFPDGQVQFWQYGSNLWSWQTVDSMRRPWQAWATQNNNGNNWMFYDYYGFDTNSSVVSANEGFGTGVPFNSMTFMNDQYQYDGLKRLFKVTDTNYSRQYSWDEYGNLSLTQNAGVNLSGLTPYNNGTNPYNTANNHILGSNYGYDARGMMTKLGGITLGYNAEGQMTSNNESSTNLTWFYDAEGQRAQKLVSGTASVLYVHDAFGQLAAEYNTTSITPKCKVCYLTYDMLGTVRLITNESQGVVGRHDYLPFAEEIPDGTAGRSGNFGAISNVTQGFTGQEADDVTGMNTASLHYFNARHLAGVLGTFVQPDPGNAGADILQPQSWNAYAYVLGDPLGSVDPDGTNAFGDFFRGIGSAISSFGSELGSLFGVNQPPCSPGVLACATGYLFPGIAGVATLPGGGSGGGGSSGGASYSATGYGKGDIDTVSTPAKNATPNYCAYQGSALSPQQYTAQGKSFATGVGVLNLAYGLDVGLSFGTGSLYGQFSKGSALDAQTKASGTTLQRASYGNYAYGAFFAGAGVPLNDALTAANAYGFKQQVAGGAYGGRTMDPRYSHLPAVNVQDIANGYNAASQGTLCHR